MGKMKRTCDILAGKPKEEKSLGECRRGYVNNIEIYFAEYFYN
jgi:hypothetical protein